MSPRSRLLLAVLTVSLNKAGAIDHVVDDTGGPVTPDFAGPSTVVDHP